MDLVFVLFVSSTGRADEIRNHRSLLFTLRPDNEHLVIGNDLPIFDNIRWDAHLTCFYSGDMAESKAPIESRQ